MCLAVPGKILSIAQDDFMRTGKISFYGTVKEISLALVPDAEVGEYVIVHAGVALNKIDEEEAQQVFAYLQEIEDQMQQGA